VSATTDAYRRKAEECEDLAKQAMDPEAKRQFKEAADHWREMADVADKHGW
jgi:hypothetical protein